MSLADIETENEEEKDAHAVSALIHVAYDNPLLNEHTLLYQFQDKHGTLKLDQLLCLSQDLIRDKDGFDNVLRDICDDINSLKQLEILMGLDSDLC